MTWRIPDWWTFLLLALAAFRVWRLAAIDTVGDPIRNRILFAGNGGDEPYSLREGLADFLKCSYCAGFWVALAWWLAWVAWPHPVIIVAVPFALSAVAGTWARTLDR